MIPVPAKEREIVALALKLIEQCRVSVGMRASYYGMLNKIAETGRWDGTKSLINLMQKQLVTAAAHIFSPVELRFSVGFKRKYPKNILERGKVVGETLTTDWESSSLDMLFGQGVYRALKYGADILKQWPSEEQGHVEYNQKLVSPWQFGVYREDVCDLDAQECLCETVTLTMPEVWQRVYHLPNADKLYERIKTHARAGEAGSQPDSFFHQVLSTSQLQTGVSTSAMPGGIVDIGVNPNYAMMGPVIAAEVVQMHELWVKDESDYTTIQLLEPDILIAPRHKKANLLGVDRMHPYTMIQPNQAENWFWGRSELIDLIEPQGLLSQWCDDAKRLMGLQIDKILGFSGENGITDEIYGNFRQSGWMNLQQGSKIEDLTPKIPPELLPMIKWCIETINVIGGFPPIMQGQGEPGVRAGSHANTLLKTASPSLRDRSLLTERQCAVAADKTLYLKEAKDPDFYWTKADKLEDTETTRFLLTDLPKDRRVVVDSHSSSPIFMDESAQLIMAARKVGDVDGQYLLDNLPFPNKEAAKAGLRERDANKAAELKALMQASPEAAEKVLAKQLGRGRR